MAPLEDSSTPRVLWKHRENYPWSTYRDLCTAWHGTRVWRAFYLRTPASPPVVRGPLSWSARPVAGHKPGPSVHLGVAGHAPSPTQVRDGRSTSFVHFPNRRIQHRDASPGSVLDPTYWRTKEAAKNDGVTSTSCPFHVQEKTQWLCTN